MLNPSPNIHLCYISSNGGIDERGAGCPAHCAVIRAAAPGGSLRCLVRASELPRTNACCITGRRTLLPASIAPSVSGRQSVGLCSSSRLYWCAATASVTPAREPNCDGGRLHGFLPTYSLGFRRSTHTAVQFWRSPTLPGDCVSSDPTHLN